MSLNREHDLMKTSFLEAKDIINKIFEYLSAPDYYFIQHMTFDELVVALYRLLGLYEGVYGDNPPHIEYIVDTFDGTATSDDILLGKIAYSKGQRIEGNIVSFPGHTYMPTTIDIVIPEKHYLEEDQIIKGDPDLLPENIRYNKNIFDTDGTFTEDGNITPDDVLLDKIGYSKGEKVVGRIPTYSVGDVILDEEHAEQIIEEGYHKEGNVRIQTQEKYAHPGIHEQIIEPDDDHVLSRVFVDGDEDLIPKNIRKDVIIFDVVGELEEFTKYNIIYVINVLKQYAYQQQVEYGEQFSIIGTQPVLDDYEFKGWSPDPNAETVVYQPGQLVTTNLADKGGAYILYAVLEEMNLADITLDITYQNGGKLHNGQEIATVVVHGGNLSTGYSNVQRDLQCDKAIFISKFANETQNSYDNQLKFTEIGFYPVIVIHKRKDKQVQATGVIKVAGENGGMNGEGTMVFETNPTVSYFDSGWISTDIIKGCWIKGYTYNYKSGGGHGSQYDELAVFGKTSSGKMILLYDFGYLANLGKEIHIGNITGADIYNNGTYKLSVGDFELTNSDLSTKQWTIKDSFTKNDDIRQLRFFASSDHGQGCFNSAHIDYDIQYEFDMDLWEEDKGRTNSHNHSYSYQITTPATCGAKGLKTGTCSCGQQVTEPIPATGKHTWNSGTVTTQPTCAAAGIKTITCTVCGQTKTESIAKLTTHTWDAGTVTKEPTATTTGIKTYTCTVCGQTKAETIPRIQNDTIDVDVLLPEDEEEIKYKWGYNEMSSSIQSGTETISASTLQAIYRRIYNTLKYNGQKDFVFNGNDVDELLDRNGEKWLQVYLADLNIGCSSRSWDATVSGSKGHIICQYVLRVVASDFPELLWRFGSYTFYYNNSTNKITTFCWQRFEESERQAMLTDMNTTFNAICTQVQSTYGIIYHNDTFYNNCKRYTESEKIKISKVIHDYLLAHSYYCNADSSDFYNQIAWPAMYPGSKYKNNDPSKYGPVCASWSAAFSYCCWKWGINAISVFGGCGNARDGRHAWNIVSYKQLTVKDSGYTNPSNWQEVDLTWDVSQNPPSGTYSNAYANANMVKNNDSCSWIHFNVTTSEIESGVTVRYYMPEYDYIGEYTEDVRSRNPFTVDTYGTVRSGTYRTYPASGTCSANKYNYLWNQKYEDYNSGWAGVVHNTTRAYGTLYSGK